MPTTLTAQPAPAAPVQLTDALPEQLEIIVTHEDIREGEPWSPWNCAVARTLQRMGYFVLAVNPGGVRISTSTRQPSRGYRATPEFAEWIRDFDNELPVHPERFVLERGPFRALL